MRKNMKGFTLIELLAVIVILAVIALIATPIIMNVINDAKIGADRDGAYSTIKTVETGIAQEMVNNTSFPTLTTCVINATGTACTSTAPAAVINIDVKGTKPTGGTIKFDAKGAATTGSTVKMGTGTFTMDASGKFGTPA